MAPSSSPESVERWIVSRLGGTAAGALGLDLSRQEDWDRWWVAACLVAGRADETVAGAAFRELAARRLDTPAALARAAPEEIAQALDGARYPAAERSALTLARASRALCERHGGSVARLAAEAEGLEDLGSRLAGLARGVGAATVSCFLRPLRGHWPAAADLPPSPAIEAAAEHLGIPWSGDSQVEAALERLGRRACLRRRAERCPLGQECPLRSWRA